MKSVSKEIGSRLPRLTISIVLAMVFWVMSVLVPPTLNKINFSLFNAGNEFLVWIVMFLVAGIFLIRALSDILVLADIAIDRFLKSLGIKGGQSKKRILNDSIYIIAVILVAAAVSPFLSSLENVGSMLQTITTYVALGMILLLFYDIGRILYRISEEKANSVVNWLVCSDNNEEK